MKILFLHGWRSISGGVKPTYLAQHGHTVMNPHLPDENFEEAARVAQAEFDRHHPDVVVRSSPGGAVAMSMHNGDARLVLLCPAWRKYGSARTVKPGTVILQSRADDVVPFRYSEELARGSGLPASALIQLDAEHRLADPEPWRKMLWACDGRAGSLLKYRRDCPHLMERAMEDPSEAQRRLILDQFTRQAVRCPPIHFAFPIVVLVATSVIDPTLRGRVSR